MFKVLAMECVSSAPLVSIVIPTYNCELYIRETLDSVFSQTYENIEVIVVDDGSLDRTAEIVGSYPKPVRLLRQKNSGVCVARNNGFMNSRGDFLCFMDHDDYWYPDKIQRQVNAFMDHPDTGLVFTSFINWFAHDSGEFPSPESMRQEEADYVDDEYSGWIYHTLLLDCWILTSTAMIKRSVLEACGSFDVGLPYSEDWDLWIRVSRNFRMIKLHLPSVLYRQHKLQGNKKVRDVDYRTQLLSSSVEKWGLCSQDGRCITKNDFRRQLARYHAAFGFSHLAVDHVLVSLRSFLKAWKLRPLNFKYPAYIVASFLGWRPRW